MSSRVRQQDRLLFNCGSKRHALLLPRTSFEITTFLKIWSIFDDVSWDKITIVQSRHVQIRRERQDPLGGAREWPVDERKGSPHPRNVNGACRRWWCVSHGWTQTETPRTRHRVSPSLHRTSRCLFLKPSPSLSFRAERLIFSFPFAITPTRWDHSGRIRLLAVPTSANRRAWSSGPIALGLPLPPALPVLIPQWTRLQLRY